MKYCIVDENNIITNIIVCEDEESAEKLGTKPYYDGAVIGGEYDSYNYRAVMELRQKVEELNMLISALTGTE